MISLQHTFNPSRVLLQTRVSVGTSTNVYAIARDGRVETRGGVASVEARGRHASPGGANGAWWRSSKEATQHQMLRRLYEVERRCTHMSPPKPLVLLTAQRADTETVPTRLVTETGRLRRARCDKISCSTSPLAAGARHGEAAEGRLKPSARS